MLKAVVLLLVTTCAFAQDIYYPHSFQQMNIIWQTVPDVDAACTNKYNQLNQVTKEGHYFNGCAMVSKDTCIIITGENTTHEILGHEVHHCYAGAFH